MHGYTSIIAGFAAFCATLTAPQALAQAVNAVNITVNTTNVVINMNTQTAIVPGGHLLGNVGPSVDVAPALVPRRANRAASFWDHNRSVVYLEASGNQRRFYYHRPRPGMAEVGASSGSLLFEGARVNNNYVGTAYVFAGRCGRYNYSVSGYVQEDRRVVMNGIAPRINQLDCSVTGHKSDVLVFDLL